MLYENLHLLSVGQVRPTPRWQMPPHRHSFHELVVPVHGTLHLTTRLGQLTAVAGDVLFYPAGMTHEERSDTQHPVQTIYLSFTWDGATADIPIIGPDVQGRIRWLVRWLHDERHSTAPSLTDVRHAVLQTILAEYLHAVSYREPSLIRRIRQFIREHVAEALSVERLALEAHMSKFHFVRQYKRSCARTPMDDVRRIRVEAARDLLLTTDLPLKAIAPRVGLANEYHLSRLVRQYLGMPPSSLRRRVSWNEATDPVSDESFCV